MLKQKVGIFSGSFNPIHIGHLVLANYISEFTDLKEVWFLVSPHNPLKKVTELLDDEVRLEMVKLALEPYKHMKISDVEFGLPRPSYTIDTLSYLSRTYPDIEFTLIIGGDNWAEIHKWKEYERLLGSFSVLIYPRLGEDVLIPEKLRRTVRVVDAPIMQISSTFVRKAIREGKDMRAFLPHKVYDYILQNRLYE